MKSNNFFGEKSFEFLPFFERNKHMAYNFIRSLIGIINDKYNKQQQQLAYSIYLEEKRNLDNALRLLLSDIFNKIPDYVKPFSYISNTAIKLEIDEYCIHALIPYIETEHHSSPYYEHLKSYAQTCADNYCSGSQNLFEGKIIELQNEFNEFNNFNDISDIKEKYITFYHNNKYKLLKLTFWDINVTDQYLKFDFKWDGSYLNNYHPNRVFS